MRFLGSVTNKNQGFQFDARGIGLRNAVADRGFNLFCDCIGHETRFLSHSANNISVMLFGSIIGRNGYATSEPESLLSSIIERYLSDGIKCFNVLDGSYVIVLWDGLKETIYISRDVHGTSLLYFYFSPRRGLAFSNNLNSLLRITALKDISHKAMHEYLRFLDIAPPYTIYENIYFLEPDKVLVSDGKEITQREIKGSSDIERHEDISFDNALKDFKGLLSQSIERRISKYDNVGVLLSGGVDSALVCAAAAKIKSNIKAFTVGFDDPVYDESQVARNIARYLGIEHKLFKFSIEDDYKGFHDFTSSIHSPFADPAVVPTMQCFKNITGSVDMVLDGTGADSLIGIMPARHIRFILRYARHIPYGTRAFLSTQLSNYNALSSYAGLFNFTRVEELLIRWQGWTEQEVSSLCNEPCDLSHTMFYKLYLRNLRKQPYELYSMLIGALPDDRIHQSASSVGLNVEFPYFDREIQGFVKGLPLKYKYNQGISKFLFRELLNEFVPLSIWDKPKHGFNYPFENLMRYDDCRLLRSFLSGDMLREHMLFDPLVAERYLQRFLNGDDTVKFKIWALVVFQAWFFNYYKLL